MEIIKYESVSSTNSVLLDMSKKNAKSWTVIWTTNQTQGRGYSGNEWNAEPNKNLAVSILISCDLSYSELIYFNQWICNVLFEVLTVYSPEVYIKWPNDLIINNKKVGGVLIETHKSKNELNIITGIGLNVNQFDFNDLPKASSLFNETQIIFSLDEILAELLTKLQNSYNLIQEKQWDHISNIYNSHLFKRNLMSSFKKEGEIFYGKIKEVNTFGQLLVELKNGEIKPFNHKELELIY